MSVRVRFAPSPTGDLHVGGARTALFNWLMARKLGGTFILRVEDTDGARNTAEASVGILKGLRWLGLDWDEGPEAGGDCGPYYQSQRKAIYDAYFAKLEAAGRVYTEDNGAVRFKFSRTAITVHDLVCGDVTFAPTEEPDMTIRRPDGSYIFHFVNVVDDIEMRMTHVIRGEDHLSNTWKHVDLFNAFGATPPTYAHIPLILNPDGSKMSKRDEGSAIEHSYMNAGYLPEAVFNYLCLLGWTPKAESEKLSRNELVALFDPEAIHSSNAKFDLKKSLWFNAQYLRELSPDDLLKQARPFLTKAGLDWRPENESRVANVVYSVREKVSLLAEIPALVKPIIELLNTGIVIKVPSDEVNKTVFPSIAQTCINELISIPESNWNPETIKHSFTTVAQATGCKLGATMSSFRYALTGQKSGPDLAEITCQLGKTVITSQFSSVYLGATGQYLQVPGK